jgi:hypothetical protein
MLAMEITFVRAALFLYPYHLAIARMSVMFRPAPACHKQLVQALVSMRMAGAVVLVGQTQHQDLSGKAHARVNYRVACTAADRPLEMIHAMQEFLAGVSTEVALEMIHAMQILLALSSLEVALELIHAMQMVLAMVAVQLLELIHAMQLKLVVISSEVALELVHAMNFVLAKVALNLLEIMNATAVPAAAHATLNLRPVHPNPQASRPRQFLRCFRH